MRNSTLNLQTSGAGLGSITRGAWMLRQSSAALWLLCSALVEGWSICKQGRGAVAWSDMPRSVLCVDDVNADWIPLVLQQELFTPCVNKCLFCFIPKLHFSKLSGLNYMFSQIMLFFFFAIFDFFFIMFYRNRFKVVSKYVCLSRFNNSISQHIDEL